MSEKSKAVKEYFGDFLSRERISTDMSVYDVGYVLGKTHAAVWYWEDGFSFPASIMVLKKLNVLYGGAPDVLKEAMDLEKARLSRKEWNLFEKEIYSSKGESCHRILPSYESKDSRDSDYKRAFGKYLIRERYGRGITPASMASAFGIRKQTYCAWENGSAFPQDVMVLVLLDKLYRNTFDVLFGLCEKNGISMRVGEKKEVLKRMKEVRGKGRWSPGKASISDEERERMREWREDREGKLSGGKK